MGSSVMPMSMTMMMLLIILLSPLDHRWPQLQSIHGEEEEERKGIDNWTMHLLLRGG